MKYRKKPVVIEAMEWLGYSSGNIRCFMGNCEYNIFEHKEEMIIHTLEGDHIASKGDFIIKGIQGEYYPCKPDIFWATYERVNE